MGRNSVRAAAVLAAVVLLCGSASAAAADTTDPAPAPTPLESPTGSYIVILDDAPAASYAGGERGLVATTPEAGEQFDPRASHVTEYVAFLEDRQRAIAEGAGVEPTATYHVTLNGFSARMSPEKAAEIAAHRGVLSVQPDDIFRPDAVPTSEYLGLAGPGGAWDILGGADAAGSGVVVGVIDTGIAPENPSFAGDRLRAVDRGEPYLSGDEVVFEKSDGVQFRSERVTGEGWKKSAYSTKLIAAQYFSAGAEGAGFDFTDDVLSPRDSDGHGSHVASIAAGVGGVAASVEDLDLGVISGVAPAAKIAAYKACYVGHDPLTTADDVCVESDLLAAIERAVVDGVDVINYSVGRDSSSSEWAADDMALYNAAVAGIFIAVSAGNAGPGASTIDRSAAPWYTTVAASTVPTFEGTVQLSTGFQAVGSSLSVPAGAAITAPTVYAGSSGLPGVAGADLCYLGSLDPAKVSGKIVVCDRGTNPRGEKSQEVADAGGVGMILVNVAPDSLDSDLHAVPTVHIDAAGREALLAEVSAGADATLVGGNATGTSIPSPQIAGFSSRGPALFDGEVLAPDVAAPGVAIPAATEGDADGDPTWGVRTGTSMAAPHVAGLGALYLGSRADATPDEIKSALMTTAYNTVNSDGTANLDPFAQGAGHIDPRRYLDPGLLYESGPAAWAGYAEAKGYTDTDVESIEGGDLNLPSIVIGDLAHTQSATRELTALRAGSYSVSASIPGVDVSVEPSTLSFDEPGDRGDFTVSFTNASATVDVWTFGHLTWIGEDGTTVRSVLAVRPVAAGADDIVSGTGSEGSTRVSALAGVTGELELTVSGLAPTTVLVDPDNAVDGHSGDSESGDAHGDVSWIVEVPTGSPLAEFRLRSSEDQIGDLDLTAYRILAPTDARYFERWVSTTDESEERITIDAPTAGHYLIVVNVSRIDPGSTWDLTSAVVPPRTDTLAISPGTVNGVAGQDAWFMLSWRDLTPDTRYLGVISYGDSDVRTIVEIDAGSAPPRADGDPAVTGDATVGSVLRVEAGEWSPDDVSVSYQWLRDGEPVPGADGDEYVVSDADVGTALSAEVIATARDNVNSGRAVSEAVIVAEGSRVDVTMDRYRGSSAEQYAVTVEVSTSRGEPATGSVSVWVDAVEYVGTLAGGRVTFSLPAQTPGIHVVVAEYGGAIGVDGATGVSGFIVD